MGGGPYLAVLLVGLIIVIVDGQLILRGSPSYLAEAYHDKRQAKRVATLVAVLFHLVMFGVVALVAAIAFSPDAGMSSVLSRIGVLLLLTALGHALTLVVLSRLRAQQTDAEMAEAQMEAVEQYHRPQARTRRHAPPGAEPTEVDAPVPDAATPDAGPPPGDGRTRSMRRDTRN
jgi:hypothetical protein